MGMEEKTGVSNNTYNKDNLHAIQTTLRHSSLTGGAAFNLVGVPHRGNPYTHKDAGRTGILLPETCGQGRTAVHLPQVPLHDGQPQWFVGERGRRQPHHSVRGQIAPLQNRRTARTVGRAHWQHVVRRPKARCARVCRQAARCRQRCAKVASGHYGASHVEVPVGGRNDFGLRGQVQGRGRHAPHARDCHRIQRHHYLSRQGAPQLLLLQTLLLLQRSRNDICHRVRLQGEVCRRDGVRTD